jgi:hypothetical protein
MKIKAIIYAAIFLSLVSCSTGRSVVKQTLKPNASQENFWQELNLLCGKAFEGEVVSAPANDTVFKNKTLIMHVRACEEGRIRVPFFVGDDRSRTWVFTKSTDRLMLKHDHRHKDGSEDSVTQYGGYTSNSGSAAVQFFPADQQTVDILPLAAGNVWWVELQPDKYFTYNLRRLGTDRLFSVRFDISKPVTAPDAPWGWKD